MSEKLTDDCIWKSYVWHKDRCIFVSTIERTYEGYSFGSKRGYETIVWEYDYASGKRGEQLLQCGDVVDHQAICRCFIAFGEIYDEENERHRRFSSE